LMVMVGPDGVTVVSACLIVAAVVWVIMAVGRLKRCATKPITQRPAVTVMMIKTRTLLDNDMLKNGLANKVLSRVFAMNVEDEVHKHSKGSFVTSAWKNQIGCCL